MNRILAEQAAKVTPAPRQLAWQEMELTAFIHFTVNTFTDREWGDGTESPSVFNPTQCDPRQWIRALSGAGFKMVILTAKHHDGFCLWPSKYTEHSVKHCPWKNGKGDVVREFTDACREFGIKAGIYLSPWDRHEPCYGDSPKYNQYFKNQLRELATEYGEISCFWFDGACAEGPNGKRQEYDWDGYFALIRELCPNAMISDVGPDARWCGNEAGNGREAEWSVVNLPNGDVHAFNKEHCQDVDIGGLEVLGKGENLVWYPSEVDTSIRPGWFYHAAEDDEVKSLKRMVDIYFNAIGGNAVLLLNLPPDRRGLLHENDVARIYELHEWLTDAFKNNLAADAKITASVAIPGHEATKAIDGNSNTYWTAPEWTENSELVIDFGNERRFNCLMLQEYVKVGQRIENFAVDAWQSGQWREIATGKTVGYKKLLRFPETVAGKIRLRISARLCPTLMTLAVYLVPDVVEAIALRKGEFLSPLLMQVVDSSSPDNCPHHLLREGGDLNWLSGKGLPQEVVIDLGQTADIAGFVAVPMANTREGHPLGYELFAATDLEALALVSKGEFGNTVNNPLPQTVRLAAPVTARYVRFRVLSTSGGFDFVHMDSLRFIAAK